MLSIPFNLRFLPLPFIFYTKMELDIERFFESTKVGDLEAIERYLQKIQPNNQNEFEEDFEEDVNQNQTSEELLSVLNYQDSNRNAPLHYAALAGYLDICQRFVELGASVNISNIFGETPLHLAAKNENVEVCQFLIENGAVIDAKISILGFFMIFL